MTTFNLFLFTGKFSYNCVHNPNNSCAAHKLFKTHLNQLHLITKLRTGYNTTLLLKRSWLQHVQSWQVYTLRQALEFGLVVNVDQSRQRAAYTQCHRVPTQDIILLATEYQTWLYRSPIEGFRTTRW